MAEFKTLAPYSRFFSYSINGALKFSPRFAYIVEPFRLRPRRTVLDNLANQIVIVRFSNFNIIEFPDFRV